MVYIIIARIIALMASISIMFEATAQSGKFLGSFYSCAHDLRGDIWVKNDRHIFIQGFNYDGTAPTAWFHGQLRPASSIQTSDPSSYVTLPFPGPSCDNLRRRYFNENVNLTLPRSIKDFETIGVFCYAFCHNFGHIIIPADLVVSPAPVDFESVLECSAPDHTPCGNPRRGDVKSKCKLGSAISIQNGKETSGSVLPGSGMKEGSGNGVSINGSTVVETGNNRNDKRETGKCGAGRLIYFSEWFVLVMFVAFGEWLNKVYDL